MSNLYESDTYAWALEQAARLRKGEPIDTENVAEELEGLAKSEKSSLVHNLEILLMHMLKWNFQPERQSKSWTANILEHRDRVNTILSENPSLGPKLPELLVQAYRRARLKAVRETGLDLKTFPVLCPFTARQILEEEDL